VAVNCCPSQDGGGDPPPTSYPCCPDAAASDAEGAVSSPGATGTVATDCCTCPACPATCNDDNSCTTNYCIRGCSGAYCAHEEINCNDDNECTNDSCNPDTGCVFEPKNCDDEVDCTSDSCNPSTGSCVHSAICDPVACCDLQGSGIDCCWEELKDPCGVTCCNDGCCGGGGQCCGPECCNPGQECCGGGCCPGDNACTLCEQICHDPPLCLDVECVVRPACDDGNPCTDDLCDPGECGDFTCTNTFNTAPCPDDGDPCTLDVCDGLAGFCIHPPGHNGAACQDDGDVCTSDICSGGICAHPPGNENGDCPPDETDCTDDYCLGGECVHPLICGAGETAAAAVCCMDVCCADPFVCCDDECQVPGCSVSLSSVTGEPCQTVNLILTGDCWPGCGSMGFSFEPQYPPEFSMIPPWLTILPVSPISCAGGAQTRTVWVTIHEDAPPGSVPILVTASAPGGSQCQATGTVTVDRTYDTVLLEYNTFIAPEILLVDTGLDPLIDKFHQGDDRWFAQHPTSRSRQTIGVRLNPRDAQYTLIGAFGTSYTYSDSPPDSDAVMCEFCPVDFDNYEDWCLAPSANWECRATAVHGVSGSVAEAALTRPTSNSALLNFRLVGKHPCLPETLTPAIDANLWLEFRQECNGSVLKPMEFRAFGVQHDGFPWHELIINGSAVYHHDPCCTRETPGSLDGSGEWTYSQSTDDPCHTPLLQKAVQEWQTVPGVGP